MEILDSNLYTYIRLPFLIVLARNKDVSIGTMKLFLFRREIKIWLHFSDFLKL
jgi:hypothetical protein